MGDFDVMGFMQLFGIIIAVYLLYAGFTGKGAAYKNNYPEKVKPQIEKLMRKLFLGLGAVWLVGGVLEYTKVFGEEASKYIFWVYSGISAVMLVTFVILVKVRYGKQMK